VTPALPHAVLDSLAALWPPSPATLGGLFLLAVVLGSAARVAVRVAECLVVVAARRRGDVPPHEPVNLQSGAARRGTLAVTAALLTVTAATVVAALAATGVVGGGLV
jgi:hypothetical protein